MSHPGPLYEKVKSHITDGILTGQFTPGQKLPSENELVNVLDVSRMTVNRALRELTRDGVIYRMQGVGSFVSEGRPANTSLAEVRDIRDIIVERGGVYAQELISGLETELTDEVADLFEMASTTKVYRLMTVHYENSLPLQLETRYVLSNFAPHLLQQNFDNTSVFKYLQAIAPVSELEHLVEARLPNGNEQKHLQLTTSQPVLAIRRRTWVGRRVVTLSYFAHPGDRYRAAVRVRPSDVGA